MGGTHRRLRNVRLRTVKGVKTAGWLMNPNYRCSVAASQKNPLPEWTAKDAAQWIRVPSKTDDKYSHGVLGMITGSKRYPGAAILGVEAAHHTGIGMVRYLGPRSVAKLVLLRRPEIVTVDGRVNAWLIGSGIDASHRSWRQKRRMLRALRSGLPIVIDAGALDLASEVTGPAVITPHARELARLLTSSRVPEATSRGTIEQLTEAIAADPAHWSELAADDLGVVVLLKGHTTHITEPAPAKGARFHITVTSSTTWLATAGSGDVLAGILGALAATNSPASATQLAQLAATASFIHANVASSVNEVTSAQISAPIAALDLTEQLSRFIADLLNKGSLRPTK